jgi:phosphopantetheine adenylyltransferase
MIEQGVAVHRLVVAVGINRTSDTLFRLEGSAGDAPRIAQTIPKCFRRVGFQSLPHRLRAIDRRLPHPARYRSESDYEYERGMRNINGDLNPAICTVFF